MRGIGAGQSVSLMVIPEVEELMRRQLSKANMTRVGRGSQVTHAVIVERAPLRPYDL